ncbi:hypothetical protein KBB27_04160, partial [Patescibacteria group bacterium]|nr:hypothetical protein [Patescibacteria group bacterium]
MKYGDHLQGTVTSVDAKGRGVLIHTLENGETRRVLVPFTSPGDVVETTFRKRDQGEWIAALERVISPGPGREPAPCPHAGICGGCLWQHLNYDAQIQLKTQALEKAYTTVGLADVLE